MPKRQIDRNSSCLCSLPKSIICCHVCLTLTCQVSKMPAVLALGQAMFNIMAVKGWSLEKKALEWLYHDHHSSLLSSCSLALNQLPAWHGSSSHTLSFCPNRHCPLLCVYRLPESSGRLCAWCLYTSSYKDLTSSCLQGVTVWSPAQPELYLL